MAFQYQKARRENTHLLIGLSPAPAVAAKPTQPCSSPLESAMASIPDDRH